MGAFASTLREEIDNAGHRRLRGTPQALGTTTDVSGPLIAARADIPAEE